MKIRHPLLLALSATVAVPAIGAQQPPAQTSISSGAQYEQRLAGGNLRVINLYQLQGAILLATPTPDSAATVERLVHEVYRPYAEFWNGYMGDETRFRKFAAALIANRAAIGVQLEKARALPMESLFNDGAQWVVTNTGLQPAGTWYLVLGPGWTNMGGLGDGTMLMDLNNSVPTAEEVAALLPHELTHMVFGTPVRKRDELRGTVLNQIVNEGLASYAAWVWGNGRRSPAQSLFYNEAEWQSALAHEQELLAAVRPMLESRTKQDIDSIAHRERRLIQGTPTAIGYFLGFRLAAAYESKYGKGSWTQILNLPMSEAVTRSGYPLLRPAR